MIRFESDYTEGAHPQIMKKLEETNLEQTAGYGTDGHCEAARRYIRRECGREDIDVHFLVGGTQTNSFVTTLALKPYQGVISASTGHINVHETGAVEASGHKVLPIPSADGKIYAPDIRRMCEEHYADGSREHMVQPGMVYISYPTENGTLYTKKELSEIYSVCREFGMYFFIDGARLGYGMASPKNEITYNELTKLCDVFYIGGTKVGALFGEALVVVDPTLKKDCRYLIKQRGAMLAKGRLLGIQFEVLFESGLYEKASNAAIRQALQIRAALEEKGIGLLYDSYTNQQFPIFTNEQYAKLSKGYVFSEWCRPDDGHIAVRICTGWATNPKNTDLLIKDIMSL